jgi:hypothetical protein
MKPTKFHHLFKLDPALDNYTVSQRLIADISQMMYSNIKIPERMLTLENLTSGGESYIINRTKYNGSDIEITKDLYIDGLLPLGFSVIIQDKEKKLELEQWTFGRSEQPLPFQFPQSMVIYKDEYDRYSIEAYCNEFLLFYDTKEITLYYGGRFTLKYLNITPEMGIFVDEKPDEKPGDNSIDLFNVLHSFYTSANRLTEFDKLYGNVYKYERNAYRWWQIERNQDKSLSKKWFKVDEKSKDVDSNGNVLVSTYEDHLIDYKKSPENGRYPHFGLYLDNSIDPIVVIRLIRRRLVHTINHEFVEYRDTFEKFLIEFSGSNMLGTPGVLTRRFPMRSVVISSQDDTLFKRIPFENDYLSNDDSGWKYYNDIPTWQSIRDLLRKFKDGLLSMTPETIRLTKTDPYLDQRIRNKFEKEKPGDKTFTDGLTQIKKGWLPFVKHIQQCTHEFEALYLTWKFIIESMGLLWGALMCRYYFSFDSSIDYSKNVKQSLVHKNGTYIIQAKKRMARHNVFSYCTLASTRKGREETEYNTPSKSKPLFDWEDPISTLQKYNVMPLIQYPKDIRLQTFFGNRYTEEVKEVEDIQLVRNYGYPRITITAPSTIQVGKRCFIWKSSTPVAPLGSFGPNLPQHLQKMYFLASNNMFVDPLIHDVNSIEVEGQWDDPSEKSVCVLYINGGSSPVCIPKNVIQLILVHEIPTSLFLSNEGTILLEETAYRHVTSDILIVLPCVQPLDIVLNSSELALTAEKDIMDAIRPKVELALGLTSKPTIEMHSPFTDKTFSAHFWFLSWSSAILSVIVTDMHGTKIIYRCRLLRNDWQDLDTQRIYHNLVPNTYAYDRPENFTLVDNGKFIRRPMVWSGKSFPYIEMIPMSTIFFLRVGIKSCWKFVLSYGFELSRFGWLPKDESSYTFSKKRTAIFDCFATILHEYRNHSTGHSKWNTLDEWSRQLNGLIAMETEWNKSLQQYFNITDPLPDYRTNPWFNPYKK